MRHLPPTAPSLRFNVSVGGGNIGRVESIILGFPLWAPTTIPPKLRNWKYLNKAAPWTKRYKRLLAQSSVLVPPLTLS